MHAIKSKQSKLNIGYISLTTIDLSVYVVGTALERWESDWASERAREREREREREMLWVRTAVALFSSFALVLKQWALSPEVEIPLRLFSRLEMI